MNSSDVHLSSINELEKVILEVDLHGLEEDERPVVSEASIGKQSYVRNNINELNKRKEDEQKIKILWVFTIF